MARAREVANLLNRKRPQLFKHKPLKTTPKYSKAILEHEKAVFKRKHRTLRLRPKHHKRKVCRALFNRRRVPLTLQKKRLKPGKARVFQTRVCSNV